MATSSTIRGGHANGRHAQALPLANFQNVGETERWLSTLGGGLLALHGLTNLGKGGLACVALGAGLLYRGLTGHCHLYGALGLSTAGSHGSATSIPAGRGVKVDKSVYVHKPAEELYHYWRHLENLPRFMRHIKSVTTDGNRSHWVATAPLGFTLEWDAEVINDRPNELIAWRSLPGSTVDSAGSVHFQKAPEGHGTWVTVVLKYDPPAGKVGTAVAHVLGQVPEAQIEEELHRFKRLMEAGEQAVAGQPPGAERMTWSR